ncbi:hypothetical protein BHY_0239 [Borrelia nietonii YOR]|uniref:Variable outer membrane protein n=1 Tax=Borrelia nietonii YOR TaxID=1293576 RepID=A0ABN4C2E9_9SPIR|nr:hypothetical protein BHY_0239 [Borrelia nietonii YOR]
MITDATTKTKDDNKINNLFTKINPYLPVFINFLKKL